MGNFAFLKRLGRLLGCVLLVAVLGVAESADAAIKKAMNLTTYESWGYTVDSTPKGERV